MGAKLTSDEIANFYQFLKRLFFIQSIICVFIIVSAFYSGNTKEEVENQTELIREFSVRTETHQGRVAQELGRNFPGLTQALIQVKFSEKQVDKFCSSGEQFYFYINSFFIFTLWKK